MQAEDRVAGKPLEKPFVDHLSGAGLAHLLGRLEDEVHRAVEIARARKVPGGCKQHRGVPVMTARVHTAIMGGSVRKGIELIQRQGIHIGAQANRALALAALEHPDHARARNAPMHLDAPLPQQAGNDLRGAMLVEAKLRVRVDVAPDLDEAARVQEIFNQFHAD